MEVQIEPEGRVEALHADDGAGAAGGVPFIAGSTRVERLDGAHEDSAAPAQYGGVADHEEADGVGEAEHPLADRHLGEHVVTQVRGGLGHAATGAGWADRAGLAREGDERTLVAGGAVHAGEAAGQDVRSQRANLGPLR